MRYLDYQQHKTLTPKLQSENNRNENYREHFVTDLKYNTNYIVSSIVSMINITMHAWHCSSQ